MICVVWLVVLIFYFVLFSYLKELKEAKQLREELLHRRTVLDQLSNELSRCTSVPKLLSHCDKYVWYWNVEWLGWYVSVDV